MINQKPLLLVVLFIMMSQLASAQQNAINNASTDFMRSDGKLYVVVAVIVTIVVGIIIYLINLDKKITKLEKENIN